MSHDTLLRAAAVVAAAAVLAAPYRHVVAGWIAQAAEAARQHRATIGRVIAAGLLIGAAWGKVPMPKLHVGPTVTVRVETPSVEMQSLVAPVAESLRSMPFGDRMLWASTWQKAGVVAAGDAVTTEVVLTDTRSLRLFTTLALDIAWRRLGRHTPGSNEPLRKAVEAAYAAAMGTKDGTVTADVRERYVALCNAMAWAGVHGG